MKDSADKSEGAPRWIASPVTLHAVQCARCLKWRVVPSKEHYEAIREHILEQPWVCENANKWRQGSHCDIPADIEQDRTMLWAIDKPNLPSAPTGWERQITVRTDGSSKFADVYYTTPLGARLRSKVEIEKYISKYPDSVPPDTTMDQFSFAIPRPLPGVCPQLTQAGGKLASPTSQAVHEEHEQQLMIQSAEHAAYEGESPALPPPSSANMYPATWEHGGMDSGDGIPEDGIPDGIPETAPETVPEMVPETVPEVTFISPQAMEARPTSSKRRNPDLTPPSYKRTKQQIKKDRLSMESPVFSAPGHQPLGASTSSTTTDHEAL